MIKLIETQHSILYEEEFKGTKYARKQFHRKTNAHMVSNEAKMMQSIQHRNIIQLVDYDLAQKWIRMELMHSSDLFKVISECKPLSLPSLKHLSQQISEGIKYLHSRGMVHRDIKLENVMFSHNLTVKLVDFGIAQYGNEVTMAGTFNYMAPELLTGQCTDLRKCDIFSLGVTLFSTIYRRPPFTCAKDTCAYWRLICNGKWKSIWDKVAKQTKIECEQFQSLVEGMLHPLPHMRPTIEEVLASPFMKGGNEQTFKVEMLQILQ